VEANFVAEKVNVFITNQCSRRLAYLTEAFSKELWHGVKEDKRNKHIRINGISTNPEFDISVTIKLVRT